MYVFEVQTSPLSSRKKKQNQNKTKIRERRQLEADGRRGVLLCRRSPTTRQLHQRISRIDSLSLSSWTEREGKNKIEKGGTQVFCFQVLPTYIGGYLDKTTGKSIMRTQNQGSLSPHCLGYVRKLFEGGQRRTNSSRRECGLE